MANIGVARASIYADLSATKYEKEAIKATERIAKTRTKSSSGDQVTFSTMEDKLRLDIAAKNGAIRSMTTAQGYLVATMNALDSGDYILKKLHDIAVQASEGNKTSDELSTLDVGAEILGDEFHKLMTSANFKGKPVFSDSNSDMKIGTGVKDTSINIGIKQVEYDDLYDHINSPTSSITPGIRYEIIKPLTDDQKETILARTSGLNAEQLVVGAQFTVIAQAANGDGAGIHTRDLYYTDGDGSVPFDATSKVSHASSFGGGYLDIKINQNKEISDNFAIVPGDGSAGTITVNSNVVSYVDPILGKSIEIGEIDGTKNGQNGKALRINFYPDATIPGTSNILNGDFSGGGTNWNVYNDRVDFGSTFTVNGRVIPTPSEAVMAQATLVNYNHTNNNPSGRTPPNNDDAVLDPDHPSERINFNVSTAAGHLLLDTGNFWFEESKKMEFQLANFANNRTMIVDLEGFANLTDTFSANLTIDFGSWTKNGGTYTFSDNNPGASINLNFAGKTVSEAAALINGINGLNAQVESVGGGASYKVTVSSTNTGFQNGFRISGSGAASDERWTTPSVPASHAHTNTFTQLASELFSANLTIDFGSWTEDGGTYTFSDNNPATSTSLNFTEKTVSEVASLINGINGLNAQLVSVGGGSSHNIKISSSSAGLQNGFRISGSGADQDKRWTTPTSPGTHPFANTFEQLSLNHQGSGILHGPATVSDPFAATQGDFLKLGYNAQGAGDWYHVASYIVDSSGTITMALNEYGYETNGEQYLSVEVPKTDTYQFVFINGTWDMSGGRKAGASMQIDDIRAERPYTITDNVVEKIMTSTNYSSSSNDQKYIKNVLVRANDGSNTIRDNSKIFNTEYDDRLMIAPTLNLEKPVSFGASNNLGPGGTTDPYVVVSKIEEVQTRISSAKAAAKAHYAVLESAIDSSTDMRAQFFWGADAISDPEFFADTAYFTKQQIMQDHASAILAQANKSQSGLMKLVDTQILSEA